MKTFLTDLNSLYLPYAYMVIGFILFILLIITLVSFKHTKKAIKETISTSLYEKDRALGIKEEANAIKRNFQKKFGDLAKVIAAFTLVSYILKDYKKEEKKERSLSKSTAKALRNTNSVKKLLSN